MTLLPQKMERQAAAALADVPIFAGLSKRHLEKIAKIAVTKRYAQDAKMVIAGDQGESFFVMLEGTALVSGGRVHRRRARRRATSSARWRFWTAFRDRRR